MFNQVITFLKGVSLRWSTNKIKETFVYIMWLKISIHWCNLKEKIYLEKTAIKELQIEITELHKCKYSKLCHLKFGILKDFVLFL